MGDPLHLTHQLRFKYTFDTCIKYSIHIYSIYLYIHIIPPFAVTYDRGCSLELDKDKPSVEDISDYLFLMISEHNIKMCEKYWRVLACTSHRCSLVLTNHPSHEPPKLMFSYPTHWNAVR